MRNGDSIPFESSLERDLVILLDFDPNVIRVVSQPIQLLLESNADGRRKYTPDYFAEFHHGSPLLIEVKYREDLWANWKKLRPGFKAAVHHSKSQGWRFKIMTEQELRHSAYLANARFLRPYFTRTIEQSTVKLLQDTLFSLGQCTPTALSLAAFSNNEQRLQALGQFWRLVAERRIGIDLHQPITMECAIWPLKGDR